MGPGAIPTTVGDDLTCLMVFIGFTRWLLLLLACYVAWVTCTVTAMKKTSEIGMWHSKVNYAELSCPVG